MLMQMIPSAEAIDQGGWEASRTIGARTFVTLCGLNPSGDTQQGFRFRIGRLERSETLEIFRKMNDVLTRAACDFENNARRRQNTTKDIENGIAIAQGGRRMLTVVAHLPHAFRELRPQDSRCIEGRRQRTKSAPRP